MNKLVFSFLFLAATIFTIHAQEPVLEVKFPLRYVEYDSERKPIIPISDSLYQNRYSDPEYGYKSPFLTKLGGRVGIYDVITVRMFWLDDTLNLKEIVPFTFRGELQGDGYGVSLPNRAPAEVRIYPPNDTDGYYIILDLPSMSEMRKGGAWYQSDTLFFYDENGQLHMVEHPANFQSRTVPQKFIQDSNAVMAALAADKKKTRFPELKWSDRYGLMRNGFPLCRIYNKDWQFFLEDQRKSSGIQPDKNHQLIPSNWFNAMNLVNISDDGAVYWGGYSAYLVTKAGYLTTRIPFPEVMSNHLVMPNGDILLSPFGEKGVFSIYRIRRTW